MDKHEYDRRESTISDRGGEGTGGEGPSSYGLLDRFLEESNMPPRYDENGASIRDHAKELAEDTRRLGVELPILKYPWDPSDYRRWLDNRDPGTNRQGTIVDTYFESIKSKNDEVIALFIENGLVTTETTDKDRRTPLIAAIEAENVRTVQQLMDFDADVNGFGVFKGPVQNRGYKSTEIQRTPLQVAAEKGNITLVKLLMETYQADDSIIAPDGQHALRLAAKNGHREIVEYLPARRGGGWRRWKTKHRRAMSRAKMAGQNIYKFFKVLLYYVPKFFIWDVPKHLIIRPLRKGVRWLGEHHKELPSIIWGWLKRTGKQIAQSMKKIPEKTWQFIKKTPKWILGFAKWIWAGMKGIPKAVKSVLLWAWDGIKKISSAIGNVLAQLFSFIHTTLGAIASFFRDVTLKDIWNAFTIFLRAVFINAPKKMWEWICKFGEVSYKVMDRLFGLLGNIVWWILRILWEVCIYVPRKVGEILAAVAQSVGGGCKEVLIWINPKRA